MASSLARGRRSSLRRAALQRAVTRTGALTVAVLFIVMLCMVQAFGQGQGAPAVPRGEQPAPAVQQTVTPQPRPHPEIGIEEHLGTYLPLDAMLYDEKGNLTELKSVITRPTVITFVYFRCPGICSPLLTELSRVVDQLSLEIGKDYDIVTISFDYREKSDLAAAKKESYLGALKHKIDPNGWRWLTADSSTIQRITDSAGFYFKRDGDVYLHAGALIVVSPTGKVTRYINGIQYLPFDVKMAVLEAAEGRTGPTIAKLLAFCYKYDPQARTYAMNVTRVSGIVIVALLFLFAGFFIFRPKKKTPGEVAR